MPLLDAGDIVVDGGSSHYRDYMRRGTQLRARGIHYLDVGTSGGVAGLERGYCLMIGGEGGVVAHLRPVSLSLASGVEAAARTPGRNGDTGGAEEGFLHCGPHGAGHFVKMVHNGIEYGVMAAYAEGLNILRMPTWVTLIGTPLKIDCSMAGRPLGVPGILMNRLGRAARACSRAAAWMVPAVSFARSGETSSDTQPSSPPLASKVDRNRSAASVTSSSASSKKMSSLS